MSNDREQWLRQRAYAIWEIEGRPDGRDRAHWETAERELSAMQAATQDGSGAEIAESKGRKPRRTEPKPAAASSRKKKPLELRP